MHRKLQIYTRKLPSDENMDFSSAIKVASKVKLKSTEMPRSPGGTPLRRFNQVDPLAGLGLNSDQGSFLQEQLLTRFRPVRPSLNPDFEDDE